MIVFILRRKSERGREREWKMMMRIEAGPQKRKEKKEELLKRKERRRNVRRLGAFLVRGVNILQLLGLKDSDADVKKRPSPFSRKGLFHAFSFFPTNIQV